MPTPIVRFNDFRVFLWRHSKGRVLPPALSNAVPKLYVCDYDVRMCSIQTNSRERFRRAKIYVALSAYWPASQIICIKLHFSYSQRNVQKNVW